MILIYDVLPLFLPLPLPSFGGFGTPKREGENL